MMLLFLVFVGDFVVFGFLLWMLLFLVFVVACVVFGLCCGLCCFWFFFEMWIFVFAMSCFFVFVDDVVFGSDEELEELSNSPNVAVRVRQRSTGKQEVDDEEAAENNQPVSKASSGKPEREEEKAVGNEGTVSLFLVFRLKFVYVSVFQF